MLLSTCLFGDKTGARAQVDTTGVRSASLVVQEPVSSSQQECRPDGRTVEPAAELDFWRLLLLRPPTFDDIEWPLASRWYRYLPASDEKDPRLQRLRRQLDLMPFSESVCLLYRTLEVEAVLDRCILQEEDRAL
ncbi:hypothetical protein PIB30_010413 [Stylosanthes scabra]|uniref:Uncharacterized protein n=1 Tax=Stylosanthes scabra TaxID=79078 RepID=A0ABU6X681_9FABA|nr:hypothetical protein [Stylosanthes scabra]